MVQPLNFYRVNLVAEHIDRGISIEHTKFLSSVALHSITVVELCA